MGDRGETPVEVPVQKPDGTPKNGLAKKIAKNATAVAVAAVAVYGAVRPEEKAREAVIQVMISHKELSKRVEELQKWAQFNRIKAEKAVTSCEAASAEAKGQADALTSFVTGYLMGRQEKQAARRRVGNGERAVAAPKEVRALVKALGRKRSTKPRRPAQTEAKLPKLSRPRPLEQRKH